MRSTVRTIACVACLVAACTLEETGANGPQEQGGHPSAGSGASEAGGGAAPAGSANGGVPETGGSSAGSPTEGGTGGAPVAGAGGTGGIDETGGTGDVGGAAASGGSGAVPGGGAGGTETGGAGGDTGGTGGTGGGPDGGTGGTGGSPGTCGDGQLDAGESCDPGPSAVFGCTSECVVDEAEFGVVRTEADGHAHGYWLGNLSVDWESARVACQINSGDLATIGSADEQAALLELVQAEETWVGGREQGLSTAFPRPMWVDGTPWNAALAQGYVSNAPDEQCIILQTTGYWRDRVCGDPYPYLCEWIAPGDLP